MKGKRLITIVVLLTLLVGGGTTAYFWSQNKAYANVFEGNGYVHIADPETEVKQVAFNEGTSWKNGLSNTVSFKDSQGTEQTVSADSFVHYDNDTLSAMSNGVLADLNDLDNAKVTNHYAIAPKVNLEPSGSGYVISNSSVDAGFVDFLWKISDKKYMLVSDNIQLHFSEEDVRDVQDYVEITYIDEGVLQLQTKENVWQTISQSCYATLNNGEKIDLVLKNVQNSVGEVLTDFSKLVLDSEDNVEVTPLTEELENVNESVIPHFDITAEPGETGDSGESGVNGSGGTPGKEGDPGTDGDTPDMEQSEILTLPEFYIDDWNPTSTGCKGTIKVSDPKNMLTDVVNGKTSRVYVVDALTGKEAATATFEGGRFTFEKVLSAGYPFSMSGLLPDREYVLVVESPIEVSSDKAYVRAFITKTFYTDSIGVYLEKNNSTEETVSIKALTKSYAEGVEDATVYLYSSQAAAAAATVSFPGTEYGINGVIRKAQINLSRGEVNCVFDNDDPYNPGTELSADSELRISSNTTYYARIVANIKESGDTESGQASAGRDIMPAQILEVTTLKTVADVGVPMLASNRTNWGFEVTPGILKDPDSGIINYRYEFANENDIDENGKVDKDGIIKTVETTSAKTVLVPVDYNAQDSNGNPPANQHGLSTGERYRVRLVVTFSDNEKVYEITSGWSDSASIEGSQLPIVRFFNATGEGESGTGESSGASENSNWYDQIYGTVRVIPGTQGSKLMLDKDHTPKVTIRASGYYYVQYPVYTSERANELQLTDGKYLIGTVDPATGEVIINIDQKAIDKLKGLAGSSSGTASNPGAVNGLRANTSYRIIVEGDLTDNGTTATDTGIVVGSSVVKTPDIQSVAISLCYQKENDDNRTLRNSSLKLFQANQGEVLDRQQQTLTSVTIEALDTLSSSKPISTVTLTQENYARTLGMSDNSKALGTVLKEGIDIDEALLQKGNPQFSALNRSSIYIRVTGALDYTTLPENQKNQNAYVPEDANNPSDNKSDHSKYYTNQFTLLNKGEQWGNNDKSADVIGADESMTITYEIPLTSSADPIPEPEKGVTVERKDDDKDGYADERYLLTANYANGAKLAKWITYYVFDDPDFHEKTYGDGYAIDNTAFPAGSGVTQKTPVTAVDGSGKGTWLAKIRVPVLTTGQYANQIPKIEFIPQTPEAYYGSDTASLTQYNNYLDSLAAGNTSVTMGNNTWKLFYPSGSTEEATGHQFVFAWTLEYEKDDADRTLCYYPFSESSYQNNTENIPHSKAVSAPRHKAIIYAKPWDSMPVNDGLDSGYTNDKMAYVDWKMYVSDPQKSIVEVSGGGTAQRSAQLYQLELDRTDSGMNLVDDGNVDSIVSLNTKEPVLEEYTEGEVVRIRLGSSGTGETADIGMRVQYYNDKYTTKGEGLFDSDDNEYSTRTKTNAQNDNVGFSVEKYIKAFRYNTVDYSLTNETKGKIADNVKVNITVPQGDVVNQLNVKVTGDKSYMEMINGIRLTFKQGNKEISLDKYVETTVDKMDSEQLWIEKEAAGNQISFNFRVSIPRELGTIAGSTANVKAEFIYETGYEGFKYLVDNNGTRQPVSIVHYSDSTMTSAKCDHLVFRQSGTMPYIEVAETLDELGEEKLKVGSFFLGRLFTSKDNSRRYDGDWHTTMEVKSTRTELWSSNSWRDEVINLDYRNGDGASGYVPRQILAKSISENNLLINGNKASSIDIPATIPVIQYINTSGYSNYISTDFTVQGKLTESTPKIYFTVEKEVTDNEGNKVRKLQKASIEQNSGVYVWSDVDTGDVETSQYVQGLGQGAATSSTERILFTDVLTANDGGYFGTHNFTNLEKDTKYFIRAYYWDGTGKFSLLNMLDISNGELKANEREISTAGSPTVSFDGGYRAIDAYEHKWLWTDVKVSNLSSYYYTVELQDENGNFITYIDVDSNLAGGRGYNKKNAFDVGRSDSTGTDANYNLIGRVIEYQRSKDSFEIKQVEDEGSYPILNTSEGGENIYLSYGTQYKMQMRLYATGSGPAYYNGVGEYNIIADADNLLNNAEGSYVKTFTVNADDDVFTLRGSYDIDAAGKPIVSFNMYYTLNSGRIRHSRAVAAVIQIHQEADGSTTYTDVTGRAQIAALGADNQIGDTYPATNVFYPGRRTIFLDVSDAPAGDKFICYIYSIMDHVTNTNTGGVDNAPDRNQILAGRNPENMSAESINIVESGVTTGVSKRLAYSTVTYNGSQTSAGKVLLETDNKNVVVSMTDPVNLKDIKTATWTIDASYMLPGESTEQRAVSTRSQQAVAIESNGSTHRFKLIPDFVIPTDAYNVVYTVSLQMYGADGTSVSMTSVSNTGRVTYNPADGIYTLSDILEL